MIQAFKNKPQNKENLLKQLQDHYDADEIIKGTYWEDGKGCAVGCTVHSDNHKCYELELGIPEWIARLEDTLFEGMDNKHAKEFPIKLIKAIPTGFDNWQHIYHQLCIHILEKECKNIDHPLTKQVICDIVTLHRVEETDKEKWSAAESAAWSAKSAAESAAWSAAKSAATSAAESATKSAAESAATSAAESAWSAAKSAAWSAATSAATSAAESAAESAAWSAAKSAAWSAAHYNISEKLIELLEAENV